MSSQAVARPSALAGIWGEMIGEFFGTMILILFGDGVVATFGLFATAVPGVNEWIVIALGWGFAVMLGVYVAGTISGAHINPAVTLGLAVTGRHPWGKVLPYWGAQVAGAFVAGGVLYGVYSNAFANALAAKHLGLGDLAQSTTGNGYGWIFYTFPKPFVGTANAFADEFLGTLLLLFMILVIVDARNQPVQSNLNPMIIGFLIVAIGLSFGLNTGYAINPARDFGPRLWVALFTGFASFSADNYYFWIPIVGPLLGGAVGALLFDWTLGRVLQAKMVGASGTTETVGEAVRETAPDAEVRGRSVREPSAE